MLDLMLYILMHVITSTVIIAFLFHITLHDKNYLNAEHLAKMPARERDSYLYKFMPKE